MFICKGELTAVNETPKNKFSLFGRNKKSCRDIHVVYSGGDDVPSGDSSETPTVTPGSTRGVSELYESEKDMIEQERGVVAYVLPEIKVNVAAIYSYKSFDIFKNVKLSADALTDYELRWNSFPRTTSPTEFDSAADSDAYFFNVDGDPITTVPENHIVNISAYLQPGTYAPVIWAVKPAGTNDTIGSSGGGCIAGASLLAIFMPLCALIFRKHSK